MSTTGLHSHMQQTTDQEQQAKKLGMKCISWAAAGSNSRLLRRVSYRATELSFSVRACQRPDGFLIFSHKQCVELTKSQRDCDEVHKHIEYMRVQMRCQVRKVELVAENVTKIYFINVIAKPDKCSTVTAISHTCHVADL